MQKLTVKKNQIINEKGKEVILRGMNLGGWLMMEGYILGGRNIPEHEFKQRFQRIYGKAGLKELECLFRKNFIGEKDFQIMRDLGFNTLRIPFHFRLAQDRDSFGFIENAVRLCSKYQLYCILDLHAAPGSQNADWHSDSSGSALFWREKKHQEKFIRIWQEIAERFKDNSTIAGFDLLNEPVYPDQDAILRFYQTVVKAIREIDPGRIIFLEGNHWAQEIEFFGKPWAEQLVYSIHFYAPLDFTFAFVRNLKYPSGEVNLKRQLLCYYRLKEKWQVPIYVGEFGQNSRCPYCHRELKWLKDCLGIFQEYGFHWSYWTYKAAAGAIFPDGLYQYQQNPSWINRQGVISGWETYYELWKRAQKDICNSWKTKNFQFNQALGNILRQANNF